MSDADDVIASLRARNAALEEANDALANRVDSALDKLVDLRHDLRTVTRERDAAIEELKQCRNQLSNMENTNSRSPQPSTPGRDIHGDLLKTPRGDETMSPDDIRRLKREVAMCREGEKSAKEIAVSAKGDLHVANLKCASLQKSITALRNRLLLLGLTQVDVQTLCENTSDIVMSPDSGKELSTLKQLLREREQEMADILRGDNSSAEEVRALRFECADLRKKLSANKTELREAQTILNAQRQSTDMLKQRLVTGEGENGQEGLERDAETLYWINLSQEQQKLIEELQLKISTLESNSSRSPSAKSPPADWEHRMIVAQADLDAACEISSIQQESLKAAYAKIRDLEQKTSNNESSVFTMPSNNELQSLVLVLNDYETCGKSNRSGWWMTDAGLIDVCQQIGIIHDINQQACEPTLSSIDQFLAQINSRIGLLVDADSKDLLELSNSLRSVIDGNNDSEALLKFKATFDVTMKTLEELNKSFQKQVSDLLLPMCNPSAAPSNSGGVVTERDDKNSKNGNGLSFVLSKSNTANKAFNDDAQDGEDEDDEYEDEDEDDDEAVPFPALQKLSDELDREEKGAERDGRLLVLLVRLLALSTTRWQQKVIQISNLLRGCVGLMTTMSEGTRGTPDLLGPTQVELANWRTRYEISERRLKKITEEYWDVRLEYERYRDESEEQNERLHLKESRLATTQERTGAVLLGQSLQHASSAFLNLHRFLVKPKSEVYKDFVANEKKQKAIDRAAKKKE